MKKLIITLTSLAAAGLFACGGGTKLDSGVDGNKKLSEVDTAEQAKLCDAATVVGKEFAVEFRDGACNLGGALAAAFNFGGVDPKELCEMAVMECDVEPVTVGMCTLDDQPNCEATVAEVEACFNDSLASTKELLGGFASKTCDELIDPSALGPVFSAQNPASCVALEAKCPDFDVGFGTETSSSS